ncbi:MAG: 2-hydroxyacyl-CoA dehydratase, partial [Dehalococcoidia bacterium]
MVKADSEEIGLARAQQIYEDRSQRARQLKKEGKKIIGYFCAYPPVEMLAAADLVPYRLLGDPRKSIARADAYVESITCSFVRSCFDVALHGGYDFLDGLVSCRACDNIWKMSSIWQYNFKLPFSHYIVLPHTTSEASMKFLRKELSMFKKHLEEFTGKSITEPRLFEAIELHNMNRALMRQVYETRKADPPLISAADMNKILVAALSIPVVESNQLLHEVIQDLKNHDSSPAQKPARLMVVAPEIDDSPLFELIENSGANVVIDDVCIGTRIYWHDVETNGDPLDNLSTRYLGKVMCPRTCSTRIESREEELDNRFGHILVLAREYNVNGVVLYILRYCDNFGFDAPDMTDYLERAGLPVLHIEDEYLVSTSKLQTRIEAFV